LKNSLTESCVSANDLRNHLDDPKWVIVDCRFNLMHPEAGRAAYEAGHIPGAVYADLDQDLASPVADDGAGGRHPLPDPAELGRLFASWGIGSDSIVVAYDDLGNAVSARLWWLLRWVGHQGVAVLDGGLDAWAEAEGPLTTRASMPVPATFEPYPGSMPVIDVEHLETDLGDNNITLLDARAAERFVGQSEPIDRVAGHIPGALNTPFQDNLGVDKCFRPKSTIKGILPYTDRRPACCQSGLHVWFGRYSVSHFAGTGDGGPAGCVFVRRFVE